MSYLLLAVMMKAGSLVTEGDDEPEDIEDQRRHEKNALITIPYPHLCSFSTGQQRQTLCLSVLMLSTNKRCNLFQTAIGIFVNSFSTPESESVIDFLAQIGVSVSAKKIT